MVPEPCLTSVVIVQTLLINKALLGTPKSLRSLVVIGRILELSLFRPEDYLKCAV